MKVALMVAEKPSLAQSLAQILSNSNMKTRKGFNGACSIHEYEGTFCNHPTKFKMTSVCGHVMSTDFVGKYNNWDKVDPAELFTAPTEKKEANAKLQIPKLLQSEARNCDFLILWLDCDKEGENICFEVINAVKSSMKPPLNKNDQIIFRAKFSAITDKDIKAAMKNLIEPNENEALSVDARQELDLRIGCAFTRFQTKFFQNKYGNLDSSLISFGPCQTPTLGFCVERHDKIASFKAEPFWVLHVKVASSQDKVLSLEWDRLRMFDNEVANMFLNMVKNRKEALVTNISQKEKAKPRPLALNTVELMRVASSGLNMGPHHAMQIAERLYTQGYISYPRTETTNYPENFDLRGTLQQQSRNSDWGSDVQEILMTGINRPRKGHDAGDHPPITPMKPASRAELDGDAWRLYDYITRHFIATLSSDLKYLHTVISFQIGEETFTCSGKALIDPGYTRLMSWQAISDEETLPELKKGDLCKVVEVKLLEKLTSPPDYLTESELITLMEKHGIGTDASIPVHINNICQRNYVTVTSGRRLVPTPLGIVLVHGYQKTRLLQDREAVAPMKESEYQRRSQEKNQIDQQLVLPTMRAAVEKQLNLIALGKENFRSVLQHTLTVFQLKFLYFVTNISSMDELFEASFSPLSESGKPQSRCGKCRRYMKLIATKPSRLHCPQCDETLSVPQNGSIRIFRELKCPLDDFELLQWTAGTKGKSFIFCPYCYNNPPFRDMAKLFGCNSCTHPTCPHSLTVTGVSNCSSCDRGVLVLDPASGPKWKLSCNRCETIIHLFEDAMKVSVEEDTCKDCGSQLVAVEYKKEKTKFSGNLTEATGCIFCDGRFSSLIDQQQAMKNRMSFRGRGRGRGRGRSSKPRGRGRSKPKDKMAQLAAYFV